MREIRHGGMEAVRLQEINKQERFLQALGIARSVKDYPRKDFPRICMRLSRNMKKSRDLMILGLHFL